MHVETFPLLLLIYNSLLELLHAAGIYNDLGSGSNVDLCVISAGKVEYLRNFERLQGKTYQRTKPVIYQPGTAGESRPS